MFIELLQGGNMSDHSSTLPGVVTGQIEVPRKSWLARNWKRLLLVAFLGIILLSVGILALIMGVLRGSEVAKGAVAKAQGNPLIVQRLGSNIEEKWMISGSINADADGSGDADIAVPISGSKGKATLYVTAHKSAGAWDYSRLIAAIGGSGEKIDLLASSQVTQPRATGDIASPALETPAAMPTGGAEAPSEAGGEAAVAVLGSGDGEQSETKAVITDLKRGANSVTLKFTIYNSSTIPMYVGSRFKADGYKENGGRSFSGIHLIDEVSKKKYFVVADTDGNCLCSEHVDDLAPRTSASLWAKFPAPPENIQKVTVEIPHFVPIDDVPIR